MPVRFVPVRLLVLSLLLVCFGLVPAFGQLLIDTPSDLGSRPLGYVEIPLEASGGMGPYTWSLVAGSELPAGVALRPDIPYPANPAYSASLAGVSVTPGPYSFTLQVTSGAETKTQTFTLAIPSFTIADQVQLLEGFVGVSYSHAMQTTSGAPTAWALRSGYLLPPGLTIDTAGVISGTPTTAGNFGFEIEASQVGETVARWYSINIYALRITSSILPIATVGVPYSTVLTAEGGTGTVTWSTGSFAEGLTLNSNGTLSGTPSRGQNYPLWVQATDSLGQTYSRGVSLCVTSAPPTLPSISPGHSGGVLLRDAEIGSPNLSYLNDFNADGGKGPYTWSASELPSWLSLKTGADLSPTNTAPTSAEVAGTPTEAGDYNFTISATDSSTPSVTVSRPFTVRVSVLRAYPPPGEGVLNTAYSSFSKVMGGNGVYTWAATGLPSGITLDTATGALTGTPVENGWFNVAWDIQDSAGHQLKQDGWIHIATTSELTAYSNQPYVGLAGEPYSYTVGVSGSADSWAVLSGELPPGLYLNGATGEISGTATTAGTYTALVKFWHSSDPANFGQRSVTIDISPVRVTSSFSVPWGNAESPYSASFTAAGGSGSYAWTLLPDSALPAGLSLSSTGVLSGTPQSAGIFSYHIAVSDGSGAPPSSFWGGLALYPPGAEPPVVITSGPDLGPWRLGMVDYLLCQTGGDGINYTWNLENGTLPPGLAMRTDFFWNQRTDCSSSLAGVATTAGTYNFTLRVTSNATSDTRAFTVKVTTLTSADSGLPMAYVGVPYSYKLTAVGNTGDVTFTLQDGPNDPQGLVLDSDGTLHGAPTASCNNCYVYFSMTDSSGILSWDGLGLQISALHVTNPGLPNAVQGTPYSVQLEAAGGTAPYHWSTSEGTPCGLTLSATGLLSGTPIEDCIFYATTSDADGNILIRGYVLNVHSSPPVLVRIHNSAPFDEQTVGHRVEYPFYISGGVAPYTWSATGMPPGMMMGTQDPAAYWSFWEGRLRGVPLEVGNYDVTVSVTDSSPVPVTVSRVFSVRISPLAVQMSFPEGQLGVAYAGGRVRLLGGVYPYPPVPVQIIDGKLHAGLTFDGATGQISGTPLESGGLRAHYSFADAGGNLYCAHYDVGVRACLTCTVSIDSGYQLSDVTTSTSYSTSLYASGAPAFKWTVDPGSTLPSGLTLQAAGQLSGTPNVPGVYRFLIRAEEDGNPANFAIREFVLNVTPLQLTSDPSFPWSNVGSSVSLPLSVSGATGTVTWRLAPDYALPSGLSIGGGALTGTLTSPGGYYFNLIAEDGAGSTLQRGFWIDVYLAGVGPPLVLELSDQTVAVGKFYLPLNASGGKPPYTYSLSSGVTAIPGTRLQNGPPLPAGWGASTTGGIFGVLTTPGVYNTSVRVTDSFGQTLDRAFTVTVPAVVITTSSSPAPASPGRLYSFVFTAEGGTGPYLWTIRSGDTSPPGLTLSGAGELAGTPSAAGYYSFTVVATDTAGSSAQYPMGLEVSPFAIDNPGVLSNGTVGVAYSTQFTASGGTGPYTWSRTSGNSLPGGLSLDASTGVLSGTPTAAYRGDFHVTATDTDTGRTVTRWFSLQILSATTQPQLSVAPSPVVLPDGTVGDSLGYTLNLSGGTPPYVWTVESGSILPPGLSLVSSCAMRYDGIPGSACLFGRLYVAGLYTFTLRLTDSATPTPAFVTKTFTLKVSPLYNDYYGLPLSGTTLVYGQPYSQPLLALGGSNSYTWTSGSLPPGLSLSSGGLLSGTPTNTGSFYSSVTSDDGTGEQLTSSLSLYIASGTPSTLSFNAGPDLGSFTLGSSVSVNLYPSGSPLSTPNYVVSPEPGSSLPPGLSLSPAGDHYLLSGVPLMPGTFSFTLKVMDAAANTGYRTMVLRVADVAYQTNTLPDASIGQPYSATLVGFGPSLSWALASGQALPPGLSLSSAGVISGIPTAPAGSYTFNVLLSGAAGVPLQRALTIRVSSLQITDPAMLPAGTVGVPYSHTFAVTGGSGPFTFTWTGSTPSGLTFTPATGVLSGTPLSAGRFTFALEVTNGGTPAKKNFTLVINAVYPSVLTFPLQSTQLSDVTLGMVSSATITPSGGVPPYTVASGSSLPPGMHLLGGVDALPGMYPGDLLLGGIPTAIGQYSFTLVFSDSAGSQIERTFSLEVTALGFGVGSLPTGLLNAPYSYQLTAVGGTTPYSYSITSGQLPPGLTLSSTGLVSGASSNVGSFTGIMIRVQDGSGGSLQRAFSINVNAPTPVTLNLSGSPQLGTWLVGPFTSVTTSASGATGAVTWSVDSGASPPGMVFLQNGSSYVLSGRPTVPGTYSWTLRATDSAIPANLGLKTYYVRVTGLTYIGPFRPLEARIGVPFSWQLTVVGGTAPYLFAITPGGVIPPGLTLSGSGLLSGMPTVSGSMTVPIVVSDSAGDSYTFTFNCQILQPSQNSPLILSPLLTLPQTGVGQPFSFLLNRLSGYGVLPFTWSLAGGSLPDGISLVSGPDAAGAQLIGIPAVAGDHTFTLNLSDSAGQSLSSVVTLRVRPVRLSPSVLPTAVVGAPYSVSFTASGGTPPVSMELLANSPMPPGLNFIGGVLSGMPTVAGIYTVQVTAWDTVMTPADRLQVGYQLVVDTPTTTVPWLMVDPAVLSVIYEKGPPPPVTPINIAALGGPATFTAAVNGIAGASLSVTAGTTPRITNLTLSSGMLLGEYTGSITVVPTGNPVLRVFVVPVFVSVRTPPPCAYSVTPSSASIVAAGGTGSLTISTQEWCPWTATTAAPWISFTSPVTGTGPGTVSYSVGANGGAQRDTNISVLGQTQAITQFGTGCSFAIDPPVVAAGAGSGSGVVAVTASDASCTWTSSSSNPSDLSFGPPSGGTGSGSVAFTISANLAGTGRVLTGTIAGRPFTVNQTGVGCTAALTPPEATVPASGGPVSVNVGVAGGCAYGPTSGLSWVAVGSGGDGSAPGGTVQLSVNANSTTVARSGTIQIGGQSFGITQQGVACSFTISGDNPVLGSGAGSGSFDVATNGSNCDWSSTSSAEWLHITPPTSRLGSGTLNFTVESNAASTTARAATLTIAGQGLTITQAGTTCSYSLGSPSGSVPYGGGSGSASLMAASVCTWTAASGASWLSITNTSGSGGASIAYTAQPNADPAPRSATVTITGIGPTVLTYQVTQAGTPCPVTLGTSSTTASAAGATGSFTFATATGGCPAPLVQSFAGWITATSTFGGTSGTANFTVAVNSGGGSRTGTVQVNDQTFTIRQTGGACTYALNVYGAWFNQAGGPGSFVGSQNQISCPPTVVANPGITLAPYSQSGNQYTQNYTVAQYVSLTPWTRLLYIDFGGQLFRVKQSSW